MPSKISAVVEQAGELNVLATVAVEQEVARSLHAVACHAVAAEPQMIDIDVWREIGAGHCAGTGRLFQYIAKCLPD